MNSEKVKEIKEKLKKQYYYLDQAYSDHLAYGGKGDEQQEEEIYFLGDILTLINEMERENERLKWEKQILEDKDTLLEKVGELSQENQQLKDRIAELEKENKDYYDRLNNAQTYIDNHEEIWKRNTKTQLQQFAERLKEKSAYSFIFGRKFIVEKDIDETLKDFLSTTV